MVQHDMENRDEDRRLTDCRRRHLPSFHVRVVATQFRNAKHLVTSNPATFNAAGISTYVGSGHTHGQTTWAVVTLAGMGLAAETIQKSVASWRV